ncbi:hypothetical protein C0585_02365 [Candidatus Woesearchaeota archaeon]|nr:MAG: hypothetical protein C0585_02365 [Candidatus Woesearchaeota archaeon]
MSIKDIEKKARKEIRLKKLISKNETLLFLKKQDPGSIAVFHMLKNMLKDPSLQFKTIEKIRNPLKNEKLVLGICLEEEAKDYMKEFTEDKKPKIEKNIIKPFIRIKLEEIKKYCDANKLKYELKKDEEYALSNFLEEFQKKHPQTYHSIIKTKEILESNIKI